MSKDIRSFFKVGNATKKKEESLPAVSKRKAANVSDDEKETVKHSDTKKKRRIIDSDEEDEKPKAKKISDKKSPKEKPAKKLVEVDVMSMFGSEPVKRKQRPKSTKPSPNTSLVINLDDDDATLDLDMSAVAENIEKEESKKKEKNGKSPHKKSESPQKKQDKSKSPVKKEIKVEPKKSPVKKEAEKRVASPPRRSPTPKKSKTSESKVASGKKEKKEKEPKIVTVEEDEAKHERKQAAAALYHKMKNRASVLNHGCKEIPKGKPDCLKGLQFVISGVLESMERDEAASLIKECGGNVVSGLSKKVTHILVGEEPGPAKIAKAQEMGITQFSEDDLLDLIRKKSGLATKSVEKPKVEEIKKEKESPGKENRVKNETKKESPVKNVKTEPKDTPQLSSPPSVAPKNLDDFSFVDKYKPTTMKQIIGQQGPSGNAQKLMNWLSNWHKNNDGTKKHAKPNPWAKDSDGAAYKAALLSGSPGVGKTTTAHLVARELLFDIVEFNASDTRSKKLLKEEVSALLSNTSISGYVSGTSVKPTRRHVLIMDEVDGMAGNEDRGGVAELIALIKDSHVPVICMCNDRNHPKIRSLSNHCFDLRFTKPTVQQIRGAMMSICFKEGIKIEPGAVDEIISGTGNDIRQTLNHLALYSASKDVKLLTGDAKKNAQISEKDIKIGQFEVVRKVFSADEHKKMSFNDHFDLFFHDYNMAPIFVQENYLKSKPNCGKPELLKRVAAAADALSFGDMIERKIRSSQAWSLLPTQAAFSSVLPGYHMSGTYTSAVNFPSWLGKQSRSNKRKRLAQEVHDHTRTSTSGSRLSVRLDYAPFLVDAIVRPLKEKGLEGVQDALEVIKEYHLLREDIDGLLELSTWPKMKNPWDSIESKVKAALTRAYNKEIQPYTYSVQAGVKKKAARSAAGDDDIELYENEDAGPPSEDEEDDSLENNAFVKVKKPAAAKASTSKAGPSTSKAGTSSKASTSKTSKSKK